MFITNFQLRAMRASERNQYEVMAQTVHFQISDLENDDLAENWQTNFFCQLAEA